MFQTDSNVSSIYISCVSIEGTLMQPTELTPEIYVGTGFAWLMAINPQESPMKKPKTILLATVASFGFIGAAQAGVIDNTSLVNPPGVYFGSGNSNSNFTVSTTGSVELGLSAITRFVGPVVPTGDTYNVPTGATAVPTKTGSVWGFVFSVNLNADGNGTNNLSNITTKLTLNDVGLGTTGFFDVRAIPDNSLYGAGGVCSPSILCTPASNFFALQNSEALSFAGVAAALGDSGYNM